MIETIQQSIVQGVTQFGKSPQVGQMTAIPRQLKRFWYLEICSWVLGAKMNDLNNITHRSSRTRGDVHEVRQAKVAAKPFKSS